MNQLALKVMLVPVIFWPLGEEAAGGGCARSALWRGARVRKASVAPRGVAVGPALGAEEEAR